MTFNGVRKCYVKVLRGRERPPWAPVERELTEVLGHPGAYLSNTKVKPRIITVPILIQGNDFSDLQKLKEDIADWLVTVKPQELIFDDEPDRIYYAVVEGSLNLNEIVRVGYGAITFICPNPYKYGLEKTKPINGQPIQINGTAPTDPIFSITLKAPTTYLAVSDGEKINMIGNPMSVDDTPKERFTRRLWSQADSTVGWTVPGAVEGGAVSGEMDTDGYRFYAKNYGSGPGWHGPARVTSLPEILTDFQVDALVELHNKSSSWGKIIVSGLDQAGNVVFSMSMGDAYSTPRALGQVRAGPQGLPHNIISHVGEPPAWNNFEGLLRVGRNKNTWFAYISRFDMRTGKYDTGMYNKWPDRGNIYTAKLAQIQVQIVSYGGRTPALAYLQDVKVFRINDLTPDEIPYIGVKDDVFEFDHKNDVIYRNGEIITKEKAFIGDYFSLDPGVNYVVAEPIEAIESAEVRWPDRWR